jgi:uncharacterized protein (UPF0262 family)
MSSTIQSIILHYPDGKPPAVMAHERERAISELCAEGYIKFQQGPPGPYKIDLSIYNRQLVLKAANVNGTELPQLILSLSPYRSIIKDYFMMIESYEKMRLDGQHAKLEPIDMARRGLHNEAAELMVARLSDKVEMDHATARRFFTLICVLHMDQARLWREG